MYLDADGLNLWLAALRNSVTIVPDDGSPGLRVLFPQALQLLATNLDLLGSVTGIVESYFLLDAFYVLQVCIGYFLLWEGYLTQGVEPTCGSIPRLSVYVPKQDCRHECQATAAVSGDSGSVDAIEPLGRSYAYFRTFS